MDKYYVYLVDRQNKTHKIFDIIPYCAVLNGRQYQHQVGISGVFKVDMDPDVSYDSWMF